MSSDLLNLPDLGDEGRRHRLVTVGHHLVGGGVRVRGRVGVGVRVRVRVRARVRVRVRGRAPPG